MESIVLSKLPVVIEFFVASVVRSFHLAVLLRGGSGGGFAPYPVPFEQLIRGMTLLAWGIRI